MVGATWKTGSGILCPELQRGGPASEGAQQGAHFYLLRCMSPWHTVIIGAAAATVFHAVAYLSASLPESLRLSVIDRALSDRSSRVRAMAIQQAETFSLRHLLPRL